MRAYHYIKAALFSLLVSLSSCSYLPETFETAEGYSLEETQDYLLLQPDNGALDKGILFVPGGLVAPQAYVKPLERFAAENKMPVLILKTRSNLAILNSKQAMRVAQDFEDINWSIGGHSLGGVVAATTVFNNHDEFESLFLMGSYVINDLSDWNRPVLSFLGENDGLTDLEGVEENATNLPEGININSPDMLEPVSTAGKTVYYTIRGGNHAQFGNYGPQEGDSVADISPEEQWEEVYSMLIILFRNNGWNV